jgi:hypothetical protein
MKLTKPDFINDDYRSFIIAVPHQWVADQRSLINYYRV